MGNIRFSDPYRYAFARVFAQTSGLFASYDDATQMIQAPSAKLAFLYLKSSQEDVWVLPRFEDSIDTWIITGTGVSNRLDMLYRQLVRFLVPTYAVIKQNTLQLFDSNSSKPIDRAGIDIGALGFYSLETSKKDRKTVGSTITLCLKVLEQVRTNPFQPERPQPKDWIQNFEQALASGDSGYAQRCIDALSALTSADNIQFMKVRLLAAQQNWRGIWEYAWFKQVVDVPMPRLVREAMLTAFHQHILNDYEHDRDIDGALNAYRQYAHKLGRLLITRAGLKRPEVLRVFGYVAADEGNHDLLDDLRSEAEDDRTLYILSELQRRLPPRIVTPKFTPYNLARQCIDNADYDGAYAYVDAIDHPYEKLFVMISVAHATRELETTRQTLNWFDSLESEDKEGLFHSFAVLRGWLNELRRLVNPPADPIQDWVEWFDTAIHQPDDSRLQESMDYLLEVTDERAWTPAQLEQVVDKLVGAHGSPLLTEATHRLAVRFAQSDSFPREDTAFHDWVDWCYSTLRDSARNETDIRLLLRYAEAYLNHNPYQLRKVSQNLKAVLSHPSPALQACAHESLDLLAYFGDQGVTLEPWLRGWINTLVENPAFSRTDALLWASFSRWAMADDLDDMLTAKANEPEWIEEDIITSLPKGYSIAIFSLDESSTTRVRDILLERNPDLKIELCHAHAFGEQAESLADKANMVVLVTRCLKHALTEAVQPIIRARKLNPVYPDARGSSSILRAIEQAVRTTQSEPII